jgi:hypothetical protein
MVTMRAGISNLNRAAIISYPVYERISDVIDVGSERPHLQRFAD